MSAVMSSAAFDSAVASNDSRSIDDLDVAICRLVRQMNAESYRMLVLVREFDDRFGYAKWTFKSCAEWLAWRCGISLSAAREKVRTAQALRTLPEISAAFADGRLSYSKVRALTRVAHVHDEDLLLAYALQATAAQVEERCRQIRNVAPESVHDARRAWVRPVADYVAQRSATARCGSRSSCRSRTASSSRGPSTRAVAAGEVTTGVEPDGDRSVEGCGLARPASRCAGRDRQDVSRWRRCRR